MIRGESGLHWHHGSGEEVKNVKLNQETHNGRSEKITWANKYNLFSNTQVTLLQNATNTVLYFSIT
jgi:hypothetical protein